MLQNWLKEETKQRKENKRKKQHRLTEKVLKKSRGRPNIIAQKLDDLITEEELDTKEETQLLQLQLQNNSQSDTYYLKNIILHYKDDQGHNVYVYHIETSSMNYRANQWTGVYMIETSIFLNE